MTPHSPNCTNTGKVGQVINRIDGWCCVAARDYIKQVAEAFQAEAAEKIPTRFERVVEDDDDPA